MIIKNIIRTIFMLTIVAVFTTSCKQTIKTDPHAGHYHSVEADTHAAHDHIAKENAHNHEALTYTLVQGNYELFMEMSPLIKGDKVKSLIHITRLSDYKPVTQEKIKISLKGIDTFNYFANSTFNGIYKSLFTPKQIGVFEFIITFADKGKTRKLNLGELAIINHDEFIPEDKHEEPNLITYLKEQAWDEKFGITELKTAPFSRVIKTSGIILPAPGDETIITAMHSGTISLNNNLIEGKQVNKGENISNISSDLIHQNLTNDYLQAKNQFEKANLDFNRASKLIKEKLISEKEYLVAKLNYESTKNTFNNIAKYYSDGNENVEAPTSGFIRSVFVQQGQFIEEGQPIATIIKNKRILLKVDVPQQYNHLASGFYTANFSPVYTDKLFRVKELNGERTSFSSALTENSLFTSVHFEFDANTEIMPGSYAEVYLKSATANNVLTVPVAALMEDQGNYFVFVMVDGEHYRKTFIKTGNSDGEYIEVQTGLHEGDYVVSKGAYQVHLASLGNAAPAHTHSH